MSIVALSSIRNVSSKTSNYIAKMIFTSKWEQPPSITTAIGLNTIHLGDSGTSVRAVAKALLPPRSSTRQVTCRTTWTVSTVMSVTNASKLGTSFSYLTINASSAKKITRMLSFAVSVKFLSVDAHLGTFLRQSEIPKPYCTLFHNTRIKRACFSHLSCARQSFTDPN